MSHFATAALCDVCHSRRTRWAVDNRGMKKIEQDFQEMMAMLLSEFPYLTEDEARELAKIAYSEDPQFGEAVEHFC